MKNDDIDLIHRILSGDESAFTILMQRHRRWVHSLAWREIGDFHAAQEITQDTFIQVFQSLPNLSDPSRFSGWLYAIAKRQCIAWLRKKPVAMQSLDTLPKAELEQLFYTQYLEEERIQASTADLQEVVEYLLQKLPVGERSVMVLHYYKGLTCEEMSARLEVSLNTVKSRLYRARKRLEREESMLRENVGLNLLKTEPRRVDIQTTATTETGDHLAEGGFNFNQTSKIFTSSGFHTKGWGGGDPSPMYMLLHYLNHGWIDLFRFPLVVGPSWEQKGGWKSQATATLAGYETVNVSAGTFPTCLKHKTIFTNANVEDSDAELRSALVNGTRYLWFAKGVGLVKMRYEHSNGVATEAELLKYEVPIQSNGEYFPIQIGTQWTYKWHNIYRDEAVIEEWRVIRNFRQLEDVGNPVQLESARYEISVDANERRVANVKCILTPKGSSGPKNDRKRLFLSMSRFGTDWLYDGYARSLRDITATDTKGKALVVEEIAKTQWVVEIRDESPVILQYKVLLDHDERDWPFGRDEAPYAQDDCIFWPGYALFIVGDVDDIELSVDVPDDWSVSTSWERLESKGHRFVCKNQDDLMSAYLVLGKHCERLAKSGEAEIVLALGGRFKASMDKVVSAVETILQAYSGVFGATPKGSMLFVMNPYGGEEYRSGGASGKSITALIGGALDDGRADFWGPLVANVVGYIWNGNAIHFTQQEYWFTEVADQEYWFTEGFSKYYSSVICTRLGLISEGDFLRSLKLAWESYLSQQGERSIREAGEDKLANRELVYDGGRLIAAALDVQIRKRTENRSSLDDVMKQMYREFGLTGTAYTMDDVIRIVNQVSGADFGPFFSKYVTGTERLPLEEYLKDVGMDVEIDFGERLPKLGYIIHEMLGIGSFGGPPGGGMFIHQSRKFQHDDRLIGISGTSVKTRDDIRRAAKDWRSGDVVELTLEREGEEIVLPVTLEGDASKEPPLESDVIDVTITKRTDSTESQRSIWSEILDEGQ